MDGGVSGGGLLGLKLLGAFLWTTLVDGGILFPCISSDIPGSEGKSIFNFINVLLPRVLHQFHTPQQRVPVALYSQLSIFTLALLMDM